MYIEAAFTLQICDLSSGKTCSPGISDVSEIQSLCTHQGVHFPLQGLPFRFIHCCSEADVLGKGQTCTHFKGEVRTERASFISQISILERGNRSSVKYRRCVQPARKYLYLIYLDCLQSIADLPS